VHHSSSFIVNTHAPEEANALHPRQSPKTDFGGTFSRAFLIGIDQSSKVGFSSLISL
jgi:hypothetical protein